jgi:hypothetical protein
MSEIICAVVLLVAVLLIWLAVRDTGCGFCGGYNVHSTECLYTKWNSGDRFKDI